MTVTDPVDAIMAVMEKAFDPRYGEAWTRRQVADALVTPNTHFSLDRFCTDARDATDTRGFTLSRQAADEEELLLIAVRPPYRQSGLGAKLLDYLAESARERGAERLFLEMRENNPAARLYNAAGFAPIGRRKAYYKLSDGSRLDAITFAKKL